MSKEKLDYDKLLHYLMKRANVKASHGILYVCHPQRGWIACDQMKSKVLLLTFISPNKRSYVSDGEINALYKRLLIEPAIQVDVEKKLQKDKLNVNNGVYDFTSGRITPRSEKDFFTYCLDFSYTSNAKIEDAEAFIAFCESSLDYDVSHQKTKYLLQIIGYVISSLEGAEKAFLLIGPSNCGKSVVLNLIEKVVGQDNICSIPINRLADRFNVAELRNARININREIASGKLKNIDIFKGLVSNERVIGEKKKQDPFPFTNHCKLLFAGNNLPVLSETDGTNDAVFNRMCVLKFPHSIDDKDKNLNLIDALYDERDIIFSAAVDEVAKIISSNYKFDVDAESQECFDIYKEGQQAILTFVDEMMTVSPDNKVHLRDVVAAFKSYCKDNCIPNCYTESNIRYYLTSIPGVKPGKFRINGSNPLSGFTGIALKCIYKEQD